MIPRRFSLIPLGFLAELRKSDVDVVTFGQYMRPTKRHMKVDRYVEPAEFDRWKQIAEDMKFLYVASGPLVRSSYKVRLCCYGGCAITQFCPFLLSQAGEFYIENILKQKKLDSTKLESTKPSTTLIDSTVSTR